MKYKILAALVAALCLAQLVAYEDAHAIRGGTPTPIARFPWMAAVAGPNGFYCGGTIIAPRVVLTAAHCVTLADPGRHEVIVGRSRLVDGRHIGIVREVAYPTYGHGGSDLGLLFLRHPAGIHPAHLGLTVAGHTRLAGWGITSAQDEWSSDVLRTGPVHPLLARTCRKAYPGDGFDNHIELCGTGGVCNGDSGSPLVVERSVVGVVSWGGGPTEDPEWGCASDAYPTVYARVSSGVRWIRSLL